MNSNLPRIITMLRKEKNISQKQAAEDLDISQALLSHYERGIRECGLDFLIRIADYYEVSTDYLLGRTTQRYSDIFALDEVPDENRQSNITQITNKKLITNTVAVLYEYLIKIGSRKLSSQVSDYLMLSVYKMFRLIYNSNRSNPERLFTLERGSFNGLTSGVMEIISSRIDAATNSDIDDEYTRSCRELEITPDKISEQYPDLSQSVFNLISHAENTLKATVK